MKFKVLEKLYSLGGELCIVQGPDKGLYVGPDEFVNSPLFLSSVKFRAGFRVVKVVSHTIFTNSHIFSARKISKNMPGLGLLEPKNAGACGMLASVLQECEDAIECNIEALRNVTYIDEVIAAPSMSTQELEVRFLTGRRAVMFEGTTACYFVSHKTLFMEEDVVQDFNITYYELPVQIAVEMIKQQTKSVKAKTPKKISKRLLATMSQKAFTSNTMN